MKRTAKLQIFLVDDHQLLRDGLKALINGHEAMTIVGEASDGVSAVDGVQTSRPDVVVMDISMPKLGGAAATRKIKARCPQTHVIALTAHEDSAYAHCLLAAGASGYVLKRTAAADLVHAIQVVANSGIYLDPAIAGQLVSTARTRANCNVDAAVELSDREAEVVRLIAEGHTMKAIAATLEISVRTLETYKARAMEKLSLENRADIVRYAIRKGWL